MIAAEPLYDVLGHVPLHHDDLLWLSFDELDVQDEDGFLGRFLHFRRPLSAPLLGVRVPYVVIMGQREVLLLMLVLLKQQGLILVEVNDFLLLLVLQFLAYLVVGTVLRVYLVKHWLSLALLVLLCRLLGVQLRLGRALAQRLWLGVALFSLVLQVFNLVQERPRRHLDAGWAWA